jgi:elongation of very long chain fatty acids protein 7
VEFKGMVALAWIGLKYLGGGHSVFMGIINSFVHVIMYLYYYLTSVDNKYKQSSWKKYITQLQMVSIGGELTKL